MNSTRWYQNAKPDHARLNANKAANQYDRSANVNVEYWSRPDVQAREATRADRNAAHRAEDAKRAARVAAYKASKAADQ